MIRPGAADAGVHHRRHLVGCFTPDRSGGRGRGLWPGGVAVLYKDLKWQRIPQLLLKAFITSATVMLVIGATGAMAWLITVEQVAQQMADWVQARWPPKMDVPDHVQRRLLLLGIFIEPLPAMLLSAPLFLPLAKHFKMDLIHIGVVMTANLAIALYTPPVGGTLFVAAKLAKHFRHRRDHPHTCGPLMAATFTVVLLVIENKPGAGLTYTPC
jgi:C4-dicarboxylate transporter DctM subunit